MKKPFLIALAFLFSLVLLAQKTDESTYLLTTKSNTFGYSNLSLIDPYLSPLTYSGTGLQYEHESRRFLSVTNTNISMQHKLDFELGYLLNPAQTSNMVYMDVNYDFGMHYHFRPMKGLVLLAGGSWDVDFGYKEVFRNVNNPGNVDLSTNLNLSGVAMYDIPLRKRTLRLTLSVETPVFGWMYVPLAGASYYEMFELGNLSNISHISTIVNRRGINPKLTLDIPLRYSVWRVGLKYQRLQYSANDMIFDRKELSFLIGTTFDMIGFGGRKHPAPKNFISTNE
jgi:hypothetical protein